MSEIFIGIIVSLVTQGYKYLVAKFGEEVSRSIILIGAFFFSVVAALIQYGAIDAELVKKVSTILAVAIGFYEVILKTVILPIIDKLKKSGDEEINI